MIYSSWVFTEEELTPEKGLMDPKKLFTKEKKQNTDIGDFPVKKLKTKRDKTLGNLNFFADKKTFQRAQRANFRKSKIDRMVKALEK